ncbi:MAG: ArnT family glycosyltransferase [Candidatus Heimdallarchaeota archaeon]
MPLRLKVTEVNKKQQKIMPPRFGGFLHLSKVTFLSGSLYLILLFFWFVYGQDFVTIDEAVYLAWSVRWASGDYYVYPLYGDKIFFFYIVSIFFRLFGVSLEVARWAVHLFGVGLLVTTYYIGKEVYSKRVGILAMLILMFSGFFQFLSYYALTDIPSAFFFAATIFFFLKAFKNKTKAKRYSFLGGLFCVLGAFSRVSYFAVFPIVGILGLKRVVRKEIAPRETLKLIGSALIVPLSAVVIALLWYRGFVFDALRLGLLPFGKEALNGVFLRERFASLLGLRQDVTTLSALIKTLLFPRLIDESLPGALRYLIREILFPGSFEGPSLAINRYYEIERWILLTVFLLSLLYRRTRSFDMLAWIVTYGFVWLVLSPSFVRIHVTEVSDRYLYPLIPAIYIQFARLIFLFLDKIRALQGGISSFDYAIRAVKNTKLFVPVTATLLGLAIWQKINLSMSLICGAISVLVFLKVGKGTRDKGSLTFVLASLATMFLVISNFSTQIQFLNAFFYSPPIQEVSYGIPPDLLSHEEIGRFEEGIWAKMSYAHLINTPFTEQIFMKDPLHTPGNFSGLYVWFSNDRANDRVEMFVRWITDDFAAPKTFSGYFQGTNVKLSMAHLVEGENTDGDKIHLEGNDYLRFNGTVLGEDFDGFDLVLDFIPNQNHYFIDWDLFQPRDPDHVFLGSMPMTMIVRHYPVWPHRIPFSSYSFHLKWRGLNRLIDRPIFFNISYTGFLFFDYQRRVNWTDDHHKLTPSKSEGGTLLPAGNYQLWGTFSKLLKEIEIIFTYGSARKHLEVDVTVDWNQTDPTYMHIGMSRRGLPLEIDFHNTKDIHDWSVSESVHSFFGRLPIGNWSFNKSLVLVWLISIALINTSAQIAPKQRITLKLRNNQLSAYYCWLVLGPLCLSSIHVITHTPPFWWDPIARGFFTAFNLSKHSGLFFWFVFEELILAGTLVLGAWFVLCDLANRISSKKHVKIVSKTPLNIAKAVSWRNGLKSVKSNPVQLPIKIRQVVARMRKFLMTLLFRIKDLPNRRKERRRVSSKQNRKTFNQIKRAGMAFIYTILIISTFFLVMRNNTRYLDQITIVQGQGYHESLRKAYLFLEGYAEKGDRVMTHQINWGKWYTKNKFTFIPMFDTWSKDVLWGTIYGQNVKFVVISEWDSFHPFEVFEESEYARDFTILWSFAGTMGFRTTIYFVKL